MGCSFEICVDRGSKCYNRSIKSLLQDNDIEMYSTHSEGMSVVPERFIRTLKIKIDISFYCSSQKLAPLNNIAIFLRILTGNKYPQIKLQRF